MELSQVLTIIKLYFKHVCRCPELSNCRLHWIWWNEVWIVCPEAGPGHLMGVLLSLTSCLCRHEHTKFYFLQHKLCYFLLLYIQ